MATPKLYFSQKNVKAEEKDAYAVFIVKLDQVSLKDVYFDYYTDDGAAKAGSDYVAKSGQLKIAAGTTFVEIKIPLKNDSEPEDDQAFYLKLKNPKNAELKDSMAYGIIAANDKPAAAAQAVVSIVPVSADKAEGKSGSTEFTFKLTRSGDASKDVTVAWSVSGDGGNPASASDFSGGKLPSGTATIKATKMESDPIKVLVAGETTAEKDEGFKVTITSPTNGAKLGTSSAAGTIRDDDTSTPAPTPPPTAMKDLADIWTLRKTMALSDLV